LWRGCLRVGRRVRNEVGGAQRTGPITSDPL
jgi:hypothetical protein